MEKMVISAGILPLFFFLFCFTVLLQHPCNLTEPCTCSTGTAEKEDIYELGVILLEVLTGRLIILASEIDDLKLQVFSRLFIHFVSAGRLADWLYHHTLLACSRIPYKIACSLRSSSGAWQNHHRN